MPAHQPCTPPQEQHRREGQAGVLSVAGAGAQCDGGGWWWVAVARDSGVRMSWLPALCASCGHDTVPARPHKYPGRLTHAGWLFTLRVVCLLRRSSGVGRVWLPPK
mgnify:CR=1 FL=1